MMRTNLFDEALRFITPCVLLNSSTFKILLLLAAHVLTGPTHPHYIHLRLQPRHDKKGKKHNHGEPVRPEIDLDHGYITSFGPMVKVSIPQPFFGYGGGGYWGFR
ncbi:unnamed protein product [Allacma fusca]|uniref:Uncharacterized protein n=1 Tax=Allacma fusca TaxID=39272 RepID=A0A8J2NTZ3_9HEXA|nr:unnamed protein product [Allacma fusca]